MLSERITVGQLLDSGIRLSWREALAITQGVAEAGSGGHSDDAARADLLSGFALEADGTVAAVADTHPDTSLSELALFLVQLLPGDNAPIERRPPAAVHLAIGRALEVVEAPPFVSIEEFTRILARLEQGSRRALLRAVYARCVARMAPAHERSSALGAGAHVAGPTEKVEKDRRTSGPRVDALRRMIRERDHHDYLVHADRLAKQSRQSDRNGSRAHGPSVDTLRRWLREADRQQFEMLGRLAAAPTKPSLMPFATLALAVCLTAGLGFAQRQPTAISGSSGKTSPREIRSTSAAVTPAVTPEAIQIRAASPERNAAQPSGALPNVVAKAVSAIPVEPVLHPRGHGAAVTRPVNARRGSRGPTRQTFADASAKSAEAGHSEQPETITSAQVSTDPAASGPLRSARKWAPLRLLSAIRHRLSAALSGT